MEPGSVLQMLIGLGLALVIEVPTLKYQLRFVRWFFAWFARATGPKPKPVDEVHRRLMASRDALRRFQAAEREADAARVQRMNRHRQALNEFDYSMLMALPQAERDAMDDEYRRQFPRHYARVMLERPDGIEEIDLGTPEGMALAESLDAAQRQHDLLRRYDARHQAGA